MAGNVSKQLAINAENGKDGVGIARWYTENDSLFMVLTDNRTIEIGNIKGPGATVAIGSVETVGSNESASVTNVGTDTDVVLNIKIPKGKDGDITDEYVSMYHSVSTNADSAHQAASIASAAAERAEAAAESINPENFVSKNANEEISGVKKFNDRVDIKKISTEERFDIEAVGSVRIWSDRGIQVEGVGATLLLYMDADFELQGDLKVNGEPVALKKDISENKFSETIQAPGIIATESALQLSGDGVFIIGGSSGIEIKGPDLTFNGEDVATINDIKTAMGDIEIPEIDESNLVHKDGNEEIAGIKTFSDGVKTSYIVGNDDRLFITADGIELASSSPVYVNTDHGFWLNGKEVAVKDDITTAMGDIEIPEIDESNLVHKDKAETITGKKTFDSIEANTIGANKGRLALVADDVVTINGKKAATTDDITAAIQSAIFDSWEVAI